MAVPGSPAAPSAARRAQGRAGVRASALLIVFHVTSRASTVTNYPLALTLEFGDYMQICKGS